MANFPYNHHRQLLDTISSSNRSRTGGGPAYAGEGNFDSNMVIILAALLCALICALGLNSIVRCAIRCSHRFVFETQNQASVRLTSTGLKKHDLNEIPVVVYGAEMDFPATDCPICLGEFKEGEKVRILPKCNHGFHVKCIDTWLLSRSSCPICRRFLCDIPASSVAEEVVDVGVRSPEIGTGDFVISVHES